MQICVEHMLVHDNFHEICHDSYILSMIEITKLIRYFI